MSHEMKQKTKSVLAICILVFLFLVLQGAIGYFNRQRFTMYNGVISAMQYGVCLLMVGVDRKKGVRVSIVLMGASMLMVARAIFGMHHMNALPGFFNSILYMITLLIVARFNKIKEIESITDVLTGVLNRRGIYKHLLERTENDTPFSVMYITLDNYKVINDNYGHAYGDELLRKVSRRMSKKLGDNGAISRFGGAEFVVTINGNLNAEEVSNEILNVIREKATLVVDKAKVECYLTCYAGLCTYPKDARDYETLLTYADIAMAEAKSNQNKEVFVFNEEMATAMTRQIEIQKLIKEGLEKDYFYLVYQPQYHLDGKKLRGFESLLRLKTPGGKFVSPGEFIPVAEKDDLILQIDDYVLRRAMREFKEIVENTDLTISVNVSAKNICNLDFIDKIKLILEETEFPAKNLEIEITEYCMVDSMNTTISIIEQLRAMEIQVALDDFGTGYTSLNYVAKLPINLLKIDKSLVDDIVNDNTSREFVHTVISMGHLMDCEVISEGVEDEKQLEYLKQDGCDFVQGYVWGKPLDYEVAKELAVGQ